MNDVYKRETAKKLKDIEGCQITYRGQVYNATLHERTVYERGVFEKWHSYTGIFACFIPDGDISGEKTMVKIDGDLHHMPIYFGHGVFLFTEYWNGDLFAEYINTPIMFTPLKEK